MAALLVVFHHTLLASVQWVARGYEGSYPATGTVGWWFFSTPLHTLWAGGDSVLVFFVLSGYVLALPAVKRGQRWFDASYYPRRLVRLYLPVWAALLAAVAVHWSVSHQSVADATWWLDAHSIHPTVKGGLDMATVLRQRDSAAFTTVLWSLTWEVWFSLLLPLFILLPLATRRRPKLAFGAGIALLVLITVGSKIGQQSVELLPGFVLGSLLAFHIDAVRALLQRAFGSAAGWVLLGVGVVILPANEEIVGNLHRLPTIGATVTYVAACVLVVAALIPGPLARFLMWRPVRWLGKVSFSLYLVHEPIVVALAFAFGGRPNVWLLFALGVPLSLAAGGVFWWLVERPTIQLARSVGVAATGRLRRPVAMPAAVAD